MPDLIEHVISFFFGSESKRETYLAKFKLGERGMKSANPSDKEGSLMHSVWHTCSVIGKGDNGQIKRPACFINQPSHPIPPSTSDEILALPFGGCMSMSN